MKNYRYLVSVIRDLYDKRESDDYNKVLYCVFKNLLVNGYECTTVRITASGGNSDEFIKHTKDTVKKLNDVGFKAELVFITYYQYDIRISIPEQNDTQNELPTADEMKNITKDNIKIRDTKLYDYNIQKANESIIKAAADCLGSIEYTFDYLGKDNTAKAETDQFLDLNNRFMEYYTNKNYICKWTTAHTMEIIWGNNEESNSNGTRH